MGNFFIMQLLKLWRLCRCYLQRAPEKWSQWSFPHARAKGRTAAKAPPETPLRAHLRNALHKIHSILMRGK